LRIDTGKERPVSDDNESLRLPTKRCLTRSQAAEYLGIGVTLFAQIGPPPVRLGRRIVYDRVDLDQWLDEYKFRGWAIKEDLWPEKKDSTEEKIRRSGGSRLSFRTDAEYAKALGLRS
jgi:predicted DNA-binding transcriptional regulator AlpA